jgi:hypothetical protein
VHQDTTACFVISERDPGSEPDGSNRFESVAGQLVCYLMMKLPIPFIVQSVPVRSKNAPKPQIWHDVQFQ